MTAETGSSNGKESVRPCPYHDPKKPDCGHRDRCPLLIYNEYVVCTCLSPMQILAVRTWIEGNVPEKPEKEVKVS